MRIVIDGMMSGTGVRDLINGGYIHREDLSFTVELNEKIDKWLLSYSAFHHEGFKDRSVAASLDAEGMAIARLVKIQMPTAEVGYYSATDLKHVPLS